mmetsp:Transcript_29096/g.73724  ORF Transcript_29096/g.73724 Transcript_29096/m.73724 type:complete len:89 (+) Transcript_29096:49-315(+)
MTTPARRRLMRDFKRLQNDPPSGISGAPAVDNIMQWYSSPPKQSQLNRWRSRSRRLLSLGGRISPSSPELLCGDHHTHAFVLLRSCPR